MATPDTRSSIVITKQFTYRGATRTFSNRYHFEGDVPPDAAHWTTFADAITADEKAVYADDVTIIAATGYDAASASSTNPHGDAVFTKTYSLVGTWVPGSGAIPAPGDVAALVRYSTPARSTKNHPVYLFNYYHGTYIPSTGGDALASGQHSALSTYSNAWITGYSDGAETHERCGPRGAVATSSSVASDVTHRDFPR